MGNAFGSLNSKHPRGDGFNLPPLQWGTAVRVRTSWKCLRKRDAFWLMYPACSKGWQANKILLSYVPDVFSLGIFPLAAWFAEPIDELWAELTWRTNILTGVKNNDNESCPFSSWFSFASQYTQLNRKQKQLSFHRTVIVNAATKWLEFLGWFFSWNIQNSTWKTSLVAVIAPLLTVSNNDAIQFGHECCEVSCRKNSVSVMSFVQDRVVASSGPIYFTKVSQGTDCGQQTNLGNLYCFLLSSISVFQSFEKSFSFL